VICRRRACRKRDAREKNLGIQGEYAMLEGLFQPLHLLIIAGIALLIFGPKKLPELGRGLGDGIRGFKSAISGKDDAKDDVDKEKKDQA
jgi:sec-independent protein translocase protein TatA